MAAAGALGPDIVSIFHFPVARAEVRIERGPLQGVRGRRRRPRGLAPRGHVDSQAGEEQRDGKNGVSLGWWAELQL